MIPITNEQKLKYLHRKLIEFSRIQDLDGDSFLSAAGVLAHQLKGNCATFDMESLSPLASLVEGAIRTSDVLAIREALVQMEQLVLTKLATMPK